jgi:pilus assembly protein CpaB
MLLIGAMVIAIGTALAARSMLSGGNVAPTVQAALPVAPTGPKVLVAQRALPPARSSRPMRSIFRNGPRT